MFVCCVCVCDDDDDDDEDDEDDDDDDDDKHLEGGANRQARLGRNPAARAGAARAAGAVVLKDSAEQVVQF